MSKETIRDLNRNTIIGYTDERGPAWSNRTDIMMADGMDNHYPGEIPADDILRRLFNFDVVDMPLFVQTDAGMMPVEGRKALTRTDNFDVLGIHSDSYRGHGYREWLVENLNKLVEGRARYGSAGLLRRGGVAWVQIEVPENMKSASGIEFRPHILAGTSFDGSLATFYKPTYTVVVCDNTMQAGMSEATGVYRQKHTSRSEFVIADARAAIDMIEITAEIVAKQIDNLAGIEVSDKTWSAFIEAHAPIKDDAAKATVTRAENTRASLTQMWRTDIRVAPFAGTAWGVLQAVNTFNEHVKTVRGMDRYERKMTRAVKGEVATDDAATLATLSDVMGRPLTFA